VSLIRTVVRILTQDDNSNVIERCQLECREDISGGRVHGTFRTLPPYKLKERLEVMFPVFFGKEGEPGEMHSGVVYTVKPIQLVQAMEGWKAIFIDQDSKTVIERIVVAWALCLVYSQLEDGSATWKNQVEGIVQLEGHMKPATESKHFIGYLEPGASVEAFLLRKGVGNGGR